MKHYVKSITFVFAFFAALTMIFTGCADKKTTMMNEARVQSELGEYEVAAAKYKEIIEAYPEYAEAYAELSETYLNIWNLERARMTAETAIVLFPRNEQIKKEFVKVYESFDSRKEAAKYLNTFSEKTDDTDVLGVIADLRNTLGDYVIVWNDAVFESLIRKAIKKPAGDIKKLDLDEITALTFLGGISASSNLWVDEKGDYAPVTAEGLATQFYIGGDSEIDGRRKYLFPSQAVKFSIDDIKYFENLERLSLAYLLVDDYSAISNCKKINYFTSSNIGGNFEDAVSTLPSLTYLQIASSRVTEKIVEYVKNSTTLKKAYFMDCTVPGTEIFDPILDLENVAVSILEAHK